MAAEIAKLSTKGQLILPKTIRDARGWAAGTEFVVEEIPGGVTLRALRQQPSRLDDVVGCLRYTGRAKTLQQMENAIAKGVRERRGRGRY
jgi:AbrB family looped-hinge helix DNA binding protein